MPVLHLFASDLWSRGGTVIAPSPLPVHTRRACRRRFYALPPSPQYISCDGHDVTVPIDLNYLRIMYCPTAQTRFFVFSACRRWFRKPVNTRFKPCTRKIATERGVHNVSCLKLRPRRTPEPLSNGRSRTWLHERQQVAAQPENCDSRSCTTHRIPRVRRCVSSGGTNGK